MYGLNFLLVCALSEAKGMVTFMKKLMMLICIILLAGASFGCMKTDNIQKQTDILNYDKTLLYNQAESLSTHLISKTFKINHVNENEKIFFSSRDIFDFVITLFAYMEDTNHPYKDVPQIKINGGAFVHYKLEDVQRTVNELFGVQDWFDPALEQFYDENSNEIIISIEQGLPFSFYSCESIEINTLKDTNYISVTFGLNEFNPYEEEKGNINHGEYEILFEVVSENNNVFLRIHSIAQAN